MLKKQFNDDGEAGIDGFVGALVSALIGMQRIENGEDADVVSEETSGNYGRFMENYRTIFKKDLHERQ